MQQRTFLVAFEYGHGAVYSMVAAATIEEIMASGPELVYHRQPPACLTEEDLQDLETRTIDLASLGHRSLVEEILLSRVTAG